MLGPRIMKLHRNIDHDSQMTPIDFEATRSEVTLTRNKMTTYYFYHEKTLAGVPYMVFNDQASTTGGL
ncbi:hypothetical protein DPMN_014769 [Dreissena polymorpha]|uniref:Uncharacterized protein n=1 Tax=Dreissena polymorpha TaxID=45954 RepID=A0A9D4S310_DREPO|nr:hypothetical protein DPMN_014769 [Dreissena polymorpha]